MLTPEVVDGSAQAQVAQDASGRWKETPRFTPHYEPVKRKKWGTPDIFREDYEVAVPEGGRPPPKKTKGPPPPPTTLSRLYHAGTIFFLVHSAFAILAPVSVMTSFPWPDMLSTPLAPGGFALTPAGAVAAESLAKLSFFAGSTAQMCLRMSALVQPMLAMLCYRLKDAELHGRMKSETYKRMNLTLIVWSAITVLTTLVSFNPFFVHSHLHVPGVFHAFYFPLPVAKAMAVSIATGVVGWMGLAKGARESGETPMACLVSTVRACGDRAVEMLRDVDWEEYPKGWFDWSMMLLWVVTLVTGTLLILHPTLLWSPKLAELAAVASAYDTSLRGSIPAILDTMSRVGDASITAALGFPLTAVASVKTAVLYSVQTLGASLLGILCIPIIISVDSMKRRRLDGSTFLALHVGLCLSCITMSIVPMLYMMSPLLVHSAMLTSTVQNGVVATISACYILGAYGFFNAWIRGYYERFPVLTDVVAALDREEKGGHLATMGVAKIPLDEHIRRVDNARIRNKGQLPVLLQIGLWYDKISDPSFRNGVHFSLSNGCPFTLFTFTIQPIHRCHSAAHVVPSIILTVK